MIRRVQTEHEFTARALFGALHGNPPQMLVLEILLKRLNIVLRLFAVLFFFFRFGIVRTKIDPGAVRRPADARHGGLMLTQATGFSPCRTDQKYLSFPNVAAFGQKGNPGAVR